MAITTLRAALTMRSYFISGSRAFTSRTFLTVPSLRSSTTTLPNYGEGSQVKQTSKLDPLESVAARVSVSSTNVLKNDTESGVRKSVPNLDRAFSLFEERAHKNEKVSERDFVKTFDILTKVVQALPMENSKPDTMSNIIVYSSLLLRCCGNLMFDTPPKTRELLAGNLWTFLKEKQIPLDISHYNNLLRVLNENQTNFDPNKILEEMKERGLNPDRVTYQRLIHQYCLQGDITGATSVLEVMKESGMELTEATFASLVIGYAKQEKPPSTAEMFELMRSNNIEPTSKSYTAAFISLTKRFATDPESAAIEFKQLVDMMSRDEVQLTLNEIVDLINYLGPYRKSHEVVDKFFGMIVHLSGSISARYRILSALMRCDYLEEASSKFWAQNVSEKTLKLGGVGTYYVRALANCNNVPAEFAINECVKLKERGWNTKAIFILFQNAAEAGRLDMVRGAFKKITESEQMKIHYVWPLIAQAKTKDEIIEVLKNDLNPKMDPSDLLETFSLWVWPRFSDNVTKLFEINKELQYDNNLLMASFLNYSVQEDKIVEAIKFISEAPEELIDDNDTAEVAEDDAEPVIMSRSRPLERDNLVSRLLNQIVDQTKDPELVLKAYNMCKLPSQQMSVKSLASLVRVHLVNDNFNKALEEFLRISREFRVTPCRTEMMSHCLLNKDPDNLQKIMNAVSDIFGEPNSLFDLAVCCLKNNKLKQAQKIFASPGFRVKPVRVYQVCRSLARHGDTSILENFVSLSRDMYDINQEYLFQVLIDMYEKREMPERALHLWNMMQEEEFQPSKRSLIMIANILERNNIEVPFQKPRLNESERNNRNKGSQRGSGGYRDYAPM